MLVRAGRTSTSTTSSTSIVGWCSIVFSPIDFVVIHCLVSPGGQFEGCWQLSAERVWSPIYSSSHGRLNSQKSSTTPDYLICRIPA